tara:strand:+ start:378 stop:665 length:288 start_codon:yes stop_codon:yes gene_type:complete
MYLNDFRVENIKKLVELLKKNNVDKLIFNIGVDLNVEEHAVLSYSPTFHRIEVSHFDINNVLYINENVISKLCPLNIFIKSLTPNSFYKDFISKL